MVTTASPAAGAGHGGGVRGADSVPDSAFDGARFGRMFPTLEPFRPEVERLQAVADRMVEAHPADEAADNPRLPSGYPTSASSSTTT